MRRDRPVLLYVVNVAWFFTSHRLPVALAAREAGYDIHVAAGTESAADTTAIQNAGFCFHYLRSVRGDGGLVTNLLTLWDLARVIWRVRPDMIHAITAKPIILAGILRRWFGVPAFVGAMTGLGYLFIEESRRRITRATVVRAMRVALGGRHARLIVQNSHDAELLAGVKAVHRSRLVLIPGSGVDLKAFRPSGEPNGVPVVVLPARMLKDKGVVEFCAAATALRREGLRAHFKLAGGLDPHNPAALSEVELRTLTEEAGVEWLGHVDDMPALFRSCHVVCLPSYREGFSKVLIEAAASQRALLTTDVPGCRDVVRHEVDGLLVPARDAEALARALRLLLTDAALRLRLATAAARRAREEFDVRRVCVETLRCYASVCQHRAVAVTGGDARSGRG